MTAHQRRVEDHSLLFELYRIAEQYRDILRFIGGNEEKVEYITRIRERVAKENVLDRVIAPMDRMTASVKPPLVS